MGTFPYIPFCTSIQSFLYGKTIFLLTFKDIEIRVFLSNDYIWKEFDPASFYMNFNGSQKKKKERKKERDCTVLRGTRSLVTCRALVRSMVSVTVQCFAHSKLPPQNRNNPQETEIWIRGNGDLKEITKLSY